MFSASRMRLALAALLAFGLLAGGAAAEGVKSIKLTLTVSQLSKSPGKIDPKAADIHARLREEFRYESLKVLERKKLKLALDQVGSVKLPTGKMVRVRPADVDDRGVLIFVDIEGILQTDLRVANGRPVDIGAQSYEDGKLVVTLEPRY